MWGFGSGQKTFIGYGSVIECSHCNNRGVEQVWATYSYEQVLFVRVKYMGQPGSKAGDGDIVFSCPICNYGFRVTGLESANVSKNSIAKGFRGSVGAAEYGVNTENELASVQNRFNVSYTKEWVSKLNIIERNSYFKVLRRLGLFDILGRLGG